MYKRNLHLSKECNFIEVTCYKTGCGLKMSKLHLQRHIESKHKPSHKQIGPIIDSYNASDIFNDWFPSVKLGMSECLNKCLNFAHGFTTNSINILKIKYNKIDEAYRSNVIVLTLDTGLPQTFTLQ